MGRHRRRMIVHTPFCSVKDRASRKVGSAGGRLSTVPVCHARCPSGLFSMAPLSLFLPRFLSHPLRAGRRPVLIQAHVDVLCCAALEASQASHRAFLCPSSSDGIKNISPTRPPLQRVVPALSSPTSPDLATTDVHVRAYVYMCLAIIADRHRWFDAETERHSRSNQAGSEACAEGGGGPPVPGQLGSLARCRIVCPTRGRSVSTRLVSLSMPLPLRSCRPDASMLRSTFRFRTFGCRHRPRPVFSAPACLLACLPVCLPLSHLPLA